MAVRFQGSGHQLKRKEETYVGDRDMESNGSVSAHVCQPIRK